VSLLNQMLPKLYRYTFLKPDVNQKADQINKKNSITHLLFLI